jgi:hypothetical protein
MDTGIRVISEASKFRATCALVTPFLYPFVLAVGLSTSGHTLAEYPHLIATGGLSLARQSVGWVCVLAYAFIYIPPALKALSARNYIATSNEWLMVPSGGPLRVQDIDEIKVTRGFWQKYLQVRSKGGLGRFAVTFAKDDVAAIRRSLEADPHLSNATIA